MPRALDRDLRGYLASNADVVTRIAKPVSIEHIPALSAQSEQPILFENIIEKPGFRLCDILVKHRTLQARALGVPQEAYLRTLAQRLRKPPRGLRDVNDGPVKEVKRLGKDADWTQLPVPIHTDAETRPYVTAMNLVKDPETGFYNTSHAGTIVSGPRTGLVSFVTPHTHVIMRKYREMGQDRMPYAFVFGVHPACEIMANYSGLHMDMWGELEMVGTVMDRDFEIVPCETLDMRVPAQAEIVAEGWVHFGRMSEVGVSISPSSYYLPRSAKLPEFELTALTMRADRPIYRNHQTCPETDHQPLPRLCHEAMVYNRLTEMGLAVKDVRFPTWGAALSCIIQFDYSPRGLRQRRADGGDGRAMAQHQDGGRGQSGHRPRPSGRRLSCDCRAMRSGARHHHRAEHAGLAVRPVGAAARRRSVLAHRRQDRHRRHRQGAPRSARFRTQLAAPLGQGAA